MADELTAFISFGGNMGNEVEIFAKALELIKDLTNVAVIGISGLYRTEPQGDKNQPWFCNQVAAIRCCGGMTAEDFLRLLLDIENKLGRKRDPERRYGPRGIDLDLLLFGDIVYNEYGVCVPHPRMTERAFVLVPLLEIDPSLRLPDGTYLKSCLKKLFYTVSGNIICQS